MREIEKIICSCGGKVINVGRTKKELKDYGCHRDNAGYVCCVESYKCNKCKTRWTFVLEAPD